VFSFATDVLGELVDTILEVKFSKQDSPVIKMAKKIVLDILNLEDGMPKLYQTAVTKKPTSRNNPEEPRSHLLCRKSLKYKCLNS